MLLGLGRTWPFYRGQFRSRIAKAILTLSGKPLKATFQGAVFVVHNDDHTTEHAILLNPNYNAAEINFLTEKLPVNGTAVDLGSNIGLYSLPMAVKVGPNGKVLCVDASAAFASKLAENAKESHLTCIAQQVVAVGDRYGTVSLMPVNGNPGTAIVTAGGAGAIVEMQPLLDVLGSHGISQIDSMKIDIDGSEELALVPFLKGAAPSLLPKRLVMEHIMLNTASKALPDALEAAGYVIVGTTKSNSLYERRA